MIGLDNPLHILLLAVVVLLVFGAKRMPEMGRSLGSGLRGFRDSLSGDADEREATGPSVLASAAASATPESRSDLTRSGSSSSLSAR